ncbi:MAG: hypothetical protein O8C63_11060 [Candidatus Methanoperedens sp.]|nr:hypothetical protein [Candidatus Methanoperedens sp.]
MNEHPNAKITVTYWSKDDVANSSQEISQQCDKSITPIAMYKATISEGDLKVVSWIDAQNKIVICSSTESLQTTTSTPTGTATVTATAIATATTSGYIIIVPGATATVTATPTAAATPGKFRVGPSVTLRPVTNVIDTNQDGIVELFMNNPSLNDVTLNVDVRISVPSGIHVYGQSLGEAAGAGVVAGMFSVPPGTARTIAVVVKADKSARIGSHTLQFTGLYWPDDNKDAFQPLSLTYSVTVKEASKNPESPEPSNPNAVPTSGQNTIVLRNVVGIRADAQAPVSSLNVSIVISPDGSQIDFSHATVKYINETTTSTLSYAVTADATHFTYTKVRDASGTGMSILAAGDLGTITINLDTSKGTNQDLEVRKKGTIQIIPETGTMVVEDIVAPNSYGTYTQTQLFP